MNKKDLFDLIESYLDGSLPDDKRQEVEQRMAADEAFRQEIELRRQLQEHFSDAGRLRLRTALKDILEEPPLSPKNRVNSRWKWAIAIIALLLTSIAIWQWRGSSSSEPQVPDFAPNLPDTTSTKEIKKPESKPEQEAQPSSKPKISIKKPIAAASPTDFEVNPRKEAYLSAVRGERPMLNLNSPPNDADFTPNPKGETLVRFTGTLGNVSKDTSAAVILKIYNNKDTDRPLDAWPLELKKAALSSNFDISKRLKYPPGLYYFVMEQAEERLYTGKFTVGKAIDK